MVRVAVVGAGFWGRNHIRVLSELDSCELVAVCDVQYERAETLARRYHIENYLTDFDELMDRVEPDAVTICTPSTTHAGLAVKAIERGVAVLIEKPMAANSREAAKVLHAAGDSGSVVMVGFIERFNPVVKLAKQLLEEGEIGGVILSYSRRIGWWPERIGDVGVVKDTAIHDIDLTTYLFNSDPEQIYAIGGSLRHSYEDHVQAVLMFGESRSALIEANWLTPRKKREMTITGENGVVGLRFIEQEIVVEKADGVKIPMIKYQEPLRLELEYFITCVKKRIPPSPGVVEGFRASLMADAIIESMQRRRQVILEEYSDRVLAEV